MANTMVAANPNTWKGKIMLSLTTAHICQGQTKMSQTDTRKTPWVFQLVPFQKGREGKWFVRHWHQLNYSWFGSLTSDQVCPHPSPRLQPSRALGMFWASALLGATGEHLLHLHCPRAPLPPRNHLHFSGNDFPLVFKEMCLLLSELDWD